MPKLSLIILPLTTESGDNVNNGNKIRMYLLAGASGLFAFASIGGMAQGTPNIGEAGFKEYCVACHADGGNIINSAKTLSKKDREKNGVLTVKDIIKIMRQPGEGMSQFDEKTLPEAEAEKIAEYIISVFK
jgi:cytochrome c6